MHLQLLRLLTVHARVMGAASEHFFANDVRMHSGLDALGCLGDMGW